MWSYCKILCFNVIGLSDLTLTTNVPDAGDEDVFMVKRFVSIFIVLLILIEKVLIMIKEESYSKINKIKFFINFINFIKIYRL